MLALVVWYRTYSVAAMHSPREEYESENYRADSEEKEESVTQNSPVLSDPGNDASVEYVHSWWLWWL